MICPKLWCVGEPRKSSCRLFAYLDGVLPGTTNSSARGITVTVLVRIWSRVPDVARGLRDDVVLLFLSATPSERSHCTGDDYRSLPVLARCRDYRWSPAALAWAHPSAAAHLTPR